MRTRWDVQLRETQALLSFSCRVPDKKIEIWMLRDYASKVWSKDFVIDVTLLGGSTNSVVSMLFGFPLKVMTDGRILLQMNRRNCDRWFYFDPRDGSTQLADQKGWSTAIYAENLVPILGF